MSKRKHVENFNSLKEQNQSISEADASNDRMNVAELTQRNALLEEEIERLYMELDEMSNGVLKRGYLYKLRDREISFASKWGLRYFVLQGDTFSYYIDDQDSRPRATINLSNCVVRTELPKKMDKFHIFSIYTTSLEETELISDDSPLDGSLVLRLSSESKAEAHMWVEMLSQACAIGRRVRRQTSDPTLSWNQSVVSKENGGLIGLDISTMDTAIEIDTNHSLLSSSSLSLNSPMNNSNSSSLLLRKTISKSNLRSDAHSTDSNVNAKNVDNTADRLSKSRTSLRKHPFPASRPIHIKSKSSPLSSDVRQGEQNYRGFFNLGMIIMILAHIRMVVDESKKRSLMDLSSTLPNDGSVSNVVPWYENCDAIDGLSQWMVSVLLCYSMEHVYATGILSNELIAVINVILSILHVVVPIVWVWMTKSSSAAAMIYLFGSTILWLKLWSYCHVNNDLRKKLAAWRTLDVSTTNAISDKNSDLWVGSQSVYVDSSYLEVHDLQYPLVSYPDNLNIRNMLYFLLIPTLCYQLNYPRTQSIRWRYVLTYIFRLFFVGAIMIYSVERFIKPTLEHSIQVMDERNIGGVLERLLKLSIPNTYVWLLGFYWFFHLYLNLAAELTRFGDRVFYKDWWNARTLDIYWRTWNMPVHHWIVRHLYYPMTRRNISKSVATFVAFLFSAALHEIIISVPFRHISFHAFVGMLAQAPLIFITKKLDKFLDNSYISNIMFWMIFCVIGEFLLKFGGNNLVFYLFSPALYRSTNGCNIVLL